MMQTGEPIPPQKFKEQCVKGICNKHAGVAPEQIMILSKFETLVEFSDMITITDVSRAIKKIENWGDYEVDVNCVMVGKESLIEMAEECRGIRDRDR